jgi:autotransporter translocation and assembly factor TamB
LDVTLYRPHVFVTESEQGWNVTRLIRPRTGPGSGGPAVVIPHLRLVDGTLDVQPFDAEARRLTELDVESALDARDGRVALVVGQMTGIDPDTGVRIEDFGVDLTVERGRIEASDLRLSTPRSRLTGGVLIPESDAAPIAFAIDANPIVLAEVRPYTSLLPDLPSDLSAVLKASGTLDAFTADWRVASSAGNATGALKGRLADAPQLAGDVRATGFDPRRWFPELDDIGPLDLTGRFTITAQTPGFQDATVAFDAQAPHVRAAGYRASMVRARGTYGEGRLDFAASAQAYGAPATATGSFIIDSRRLSIGGRFSHVDLRALPASLGVPEIDSDLSGTYSVTGASGDWRVGAQFEASTLAGGRLADGGTAQLDLAGDVVSYAAVLTIEGLDLQRAIQLAPEPPSQLAGLTGLVNARIDLDATGTSLETMSGVADVRLTDSTADGVQLEMLEVKASLENHALQATVAGRLDGDIGQAGRFGEPRQYVAAGTITAAVSIPDVTQELRLDDVSASVQAALERTSIRGIVLEHVSLDAALTRGRVELAELKATGPNVDVAASGTLAVGGDASSDLTYEVVADLSALDTLLNQPVRGNARLAGRATGPSDRPTATGTIQAANVSSEAADVLSFKGEYSVTLPNFDVGQVEGAIDAVASFLTVGDRQADQVTATLAYRNRQVEIDATVRQGARTLEIDSTVVPHPNHHEVHIRRASLGVGEVTWTLQGPEAVVRYGPDRLEVERVTLAHDDASVSIDGILSEAADTALTVRAAGIQLADIKTLLLTDREVTGVLDLDATVTGSVAALRADLTGSVTDGTVDGVAFGRLDVEAGYADNTLSLRAELEAGPSGHLTATGSMPLVLGDGTTAARPPFDLTIQSTAIDVGLFQAALPHVSQVRGSGEFDVRVTGETPDVTGTIALRDVAFSVPASGVSYRALNASLTLSGRRLEVGRLQIEDADGDVAVIQGTADVPGGSPAGSMELRIEADAFDVLDNDYGELAISAELTAMGDFRTPLLSGTITVNRGLIEVDRLLRRLDAGYTPVAAATAAEDPETPLERASLSITLAMPDNIVLRGRDLRPGSGSVGLGDVNVTVGGALSLAKAIGGTPTIAGRMDVVRGQYRFQGRAFAIARGSSVRFRGDPASPALDIDAERTISGVVATVHLSGTPAQPEIALRSDPPLDQSDVLALVVFGQSMNRLGSPQRVSLAARAGALAAGALATPLADSVASALNLDIVDIQPVATSEGGASILLGRQVSDRLFVGFRHEFGADISRVTFEYRISQFLRLVTSLAQNGNQTMTTRQADEAGIDLIFVVR